MKPCDWCGDMHDVTALCQRAQRGMTRRSFLFLSASAAVGAIVAPQMPLDGIWMTLDKSKWAKGANPNIGKLVAEEWNRLIGQQLAGDIFIDRHFRDLLAANIKERL